MVMVTGKMYCDAVMCLQNIKQGDGINASFFFVKPIGQHHRERGIEKHTNHKLYKKMNRLQLVNADRSVTHVITILRDKLVTQFAVNTT